MSRGRCWTREARCPVALCRRCWRGQSSALQQHVGEAGPQHAVLVGSDPAPGRARHPPGICSCFPKTAPFIFLRLGLSSDGSPEAVAGGKEREREGGGCVLEKHLLSRYRGLWPRGQRWCEEGREGKHRWCFLSCQSCGTRAVRREWGWGMVGGMCFGVREQVGGRGAAPVPARREGAGGDSTGAQAPVVLTRQGVRAITPGRSDSRGGISGRCLPPGCGTPVPAHFPSWVPSLPSLTLPYSGEDFYLQGRHYTYYRFFSKVIYGLPFI